MLLTQALFQSEHGIATRRKLIGRKNGHDRFEYHTATLSHRGQVHVINGRNGTIRKDSLEDRARIDWEPFAPSKLRAPKIKPVKTDD